MTEAVNKQSQTLPRRVLKYQLDLVNKVTYTSHLPEACELVAFQRSRDEEMLLKLNNEIFFGHPDQGAWTTGKLLTKLNESLRSESDIQILLQQGTPIAYLWLKYHQLLGAAPCEIYVLGVLEQFRRNGVGAFLVSEALTNMQEFGCKRAWVYTDETNLKARNLYESFGFLLDFIEEL